MLNRLTLALGAVVLTAGTDAAVRVSVDLETVRAEVPRTLYGTGMEDVNHEIYGGLDAQRLYDESFETEVPNGRAEAVSGGWIPVSDGKGRFERDWRAVHLGQTSQRLLPNGGWAGVANMGLNGWGVPCRAGRKMNGRFFVRGGADRLEISLQCSDGSITYARTTAKTFGDLQWHRIDFSLVPNATDPRARLLIAAFGGRGVWIDDAYLADEPTNEFGRLGCREDLVDGFRREGLTFLRWGGSMANSPEYLLKNMRGDRRPYVGFWFKWSSTGFLYKEFVRMADAMKLPCAFSIFAYEDTDEAVKLAEWLRQFKGTILVEIGNEECCGYTPVCGERNLACVRAYGASVRRLVSAMRKANPALKFVSAMQWDLTPQPLLDEAFRLTDGVVDYWDLHTDAFKVDAAPGVRKMLGAFKDMIARINPKSTMKAAVFEENGRTHGMDRALAHALTLEAVRECGDLVLTSCPANALQAWKQNENGWDQGQIFYTTDRVWLQPCGWAQQMASAAHRDLLVAGSTDSAQVTVSATRDREKRSAVLHFVNQTKDAQPLEIAFKAGTPKLAKVTVLSSERLEADNPPESPDGISPKDDTAAFRSAPVLKPHSYTVVEYSL